MFWGCDVAEIRHDVRVRMYLASRWTDVTGYVLQRNTIAITRGRKDENTQTPPSTASLSLKNNDGRFSLRNPMGPYYGSLGQNNLIEIEKKLALDFFSRVESIGLGTSDGGPGVPRHRWTMPLPASFTCAASGAQVTVATANTSRIAYLPEFRQADVTATLEVSVPISNVTGGALGLEGPIVRGVSPSNYIAASARIETDESITLAIFNISGTDYVTATTIPGITHSAGARYKIKVAADGTTVAAKIWRVDAGAGEPRDWQVSANNVPRVAGWVGGRSALWSGSTNAPLTFTWHSFEAGSMRFTGEVSSYPATSQANGKDQFVPIEAAGIMRRLGQGQAPTLSAIRRGILSVNPVAYWPCEEGPDATALSSAIEGVQPMEIVPAPLLPDFAADSAFDCSAPIPNMALTSWVGIPPPYDTSAGQMQVRILTHISDGGVTAKCRLMRIITTGTARLWDILIHPDGSLEVDIFDASGGVILDGGSVGFGMNGDLCRVSFDLVQNGGNVDWTLGKLTVGAGGAGFINGTATGYTFDRVDRIELGNNILNGDAVGHVTLENRVTSLFALADQLNAHKGERAGTRMSRLSTENGVPFTYYGTASASMKAGAQRVDTYLNLIRSSANGVSDVDGGTVHERRSFNALAYRDRRSIYAQSSTITLTLSAGHIAAPFQPVDDDQGTRNDITLSRTGGGEFRRTLLTGRKSVLDPPNGVGVYDDSPDQNLFEDGQLPDSSGFLLALGTVDEARYTSLKINLDSPDFVRSGLAGAVLDLDIDDRITINGTSGVWVFDDVNQLARGYQETLGNHEHSFSFNLSPSQPYDVGTIDGGTYRIGSGTSTVNTALSETGTSISVATSSTPDLWTTNGAVFPMDVMIGGERITLSAISGASSPQTFTVSARSVNGVRKSHAVGTKVTPFFPWRLGL